MSTDVSAQAKTPLGPQEAVAVARDYLLQFFPRAQNVRPEEIELSEDKQFILVTLSFRDGDPIPGLVFPRDFKVFKIDASTGEVRSMKSPQLS